MWYKHHLHLSTIYLYGKRDCNFNHFSIIYSLVGFSLKKIKRKKWFFLEEKIIVYPPPPPPFKCLRWCPLIVNMWYRCPLNAIYFTKNILKSLQTITLLEVTSYNNQTIKYLLKTRIVKELKKRPILDFY